MNQLLANSRNIALVNAVQAAISRQGPVAASASQAQGPSIALNGVVPLYSKANTIQAGEWVSIYGSKSRQPDRFMEQRLSTLARRHQRHDQ